MNCFFKIKSELDKPGLHSRILSQKDEKRERVRDRERERREKENETHLITL
jgi:hypothetical protein